MSAVRGEFEGECVDIVWLNRAKTQVKQLNLTDGGEAKT